MQCANLRRTSAGAYLNLNKNVCLFFPTGQGMVEMWSTIPYNASLVDAVDMVVSPRHEKHVKVRGFN